MIEYKFCKISRKFVVLNFLSKVIVNVIVLFMVTKIFQNIYIDSMFSLFIISILLTLLNKLLKPFLIVIMLPLNIVTLGITYPLINVLILKLISLIMGKHFLLIGWGTVFIISIFISITTFFFDIIIGRQIRRV